jgi:ParB family chromosome partitioning protein
MGNLALAGFDDIFNSSAPISGESVVEVKLSELHPPDFHPFQINDDEAMERLVESVKQYGVREPGIVRPREDGGYELLCGNRRKRACEIAEMVSMPVIIRILDDDSAAITMVDSNLEQREKILYSEKAWAYKVKLEALKHKGVKSGSHSVEVLVAQTGQSKNQIFRLIRLTELIIDLLDKVDTKQLAFNPAVELSYLSQTEQTAVSSTMDKYGVKPSLSQTVKLKKMKQVGELTVDAIDSLLSEEKNPPKEKQTGIERYREYFPTHYSQKQIEEIIVKLILDWKSGQQ